MSGSWTHEGHAPSTRITMSFRVHNGVGEADTLCRQISHIENEGDAFLLKRIGDVGSESSLGSWGFHQDSQLAGFASFMTRNSQVSVHSRGCPKDGTEDTYLRFENKWKVLEGRLFHL